MKNGTLNYNKPTMPPLGPTGVGPNGEKWEWRAANADERARGVLQVLVDANLEPVTSAGEASNGNG